jgi:hypothetical protein
MSIKAKHKKARRINRIWKEDLKRKYVRKEENWETFNLFLNREIGYKPARQSIFDIIYDIVDKHLNGLEFKSEDVDGIKELYFKNGEEDS